MGSVFILLFTLQASLAKEDQLQPIDHASLPEEQGSKPHSGLLSFVSELFTSNSPSIEEKRNLRQESKQQRKTGALHILEGLIRPDRPRYDSGPYVQFRNLVFPNLCMELPLGLTYNGNGLELGFCNGSISQLWSIDRDGYIHSASDFDKCVHLSSALHLSGSPVVIWNCQKRQIAQQWYLTPNNNLKPAGDFSMCVDSVNQLTPQLRIFYCHSIINEGWFITIDRRFNNGRPVIPDYYHAWMDYSSGDSEDYDHDHDYDHDYDHDDYYYRSHDHSHDFYH